MEGWHDDYMLNGLTAEILRFLSGGIRSRPDRAERLGLHAQVLYCGRVCPGSQVDQRESRETGPTCTGTLLWKGLPR